MSFQTWVIIALVLFGWYWYNNPVNATNIIDNGIEGTQSLIQQFTNKDGTCSDTFDPVCANNITYDNACKAKTTDYVIGEC